MTTVALDSLQTYDRVEVTFKRTADARKAVGRLWGMDSESHNGMLTLSIGTPQSRLPGEGAWMDDSWEGNLTRTFVFRVGRTFDAQRFLRELGNHIETIKVGS